MRFGFVDFSDQDVRELLRLHYEEMLSSSPPGTAYVLDLEELDTDDIDMIGVWAGKRLLAIGAVRHHPDFAEIKSMRAHPDARGKGAGRALLNYLLAHARNAGHMCVRLETGKGEVFAPANALYQSSGFVPCGPFAGYQPSDFNRFYQLML